MNTRDIKRFRSKIDYSGGPHACWPWLAGTDKDGYGKFQIGPHGKQKHLRAHRVALRIHTGRWGRIAMHWKCDNQPCCNPKHLKWATVRENRNDTTEKGRDARGTKHGSRTCPDAVPRGEKHYRAKLSAADVATIRRIYVPRQGIGALAKRFGVCLATISSVATGRNRKHG